MRAGKIFLLACVMLVPCAHAQSLFNGTWRPDPQRPSAAEPPDDIELAGGIYNCRSCTPPYSVKADGHEQPVKDNPRFDAVTITVLDARSIEKSAKKGTQTIAHSKISISADGNSKTEVQTISGMAPHPVEMAIKSSRLSAAAPGAHTASGTWRIVEADLVNHDEDTNYEVHDGSLSMMDGLGRSFTAKLDGPDAPYRGDPRFSSVSLRLIDSRTIEETDKQGSVVVLVTRWNVEPDGKTMHVRFDDTHGFVQEQTGHKLP
jgi:hypothetical protein